MATSDEVVEEFAKELRAIKALYKEDTVIAGMVVTLAEIIAAQKLPEAYLGFIITNLVGEVNNRRTYNGNQN